MEQLREKIRGIFVLALTPMKDDFSVDHQALKRNIEYYLNSGVHGIVVGGTYAEYPSLEVSERLAIFKTAIETVNKQVPVVCCTAASGTGEAIQLSLEAQKLGADLVMVTGPYVSEVSDKDVIYHFEQLNEHLDIPIMIYNSTSIGNTLSPDVLYEVGKLEKVICVKQADTNLHAQVRTIASSSENMSILCGSDGVMLGSLALGMPGCTSTLANFIPEEYVALYNEFIGGNLEAAQKRFYRWEPIRAFCRKYGQPAVAKAAMELLGLPSGPVRAPFRSLNNVEKEELNVVLETVGVRRKLNV
ncbi:dihydrodipicolinate synthase family protein [Robertmurraya massiliosenegalensis]|uniref:dihydrodipicolinate synthase family protein n=1 Tax=Robertmurraya TaxID=2837507 RepID=UPI0039A48D38